MRSFSNGLQVSADHVRLGSQTWAVAAIKNVGLNPSGSGLGMLVWGPTCLFLIYAGLNSIGTAHSGGSFALLFLAAWAGYGTYASYKAVMSKQVWIKTGVLPVIVYKSRNNNEAEEVRSAIEQAMT